MRALSIFAVVFFHAAPTLRWLNGHHGVTFFFVLSGYLITTLLLREEHAHGRVSLAAFYVRRTFRILPLYYLTLALYCVLLLGLEVQPERAAFFRRALPYYVLYFPEYIHLNGGGPFSHSWSLGIEEKFYAVWPLLGFALLRGRSERSLALLALIGVILWLPSSLHWAKFVSPYVPILVGCLIALLLDRRELFDRLRPLGSHPGFWLVLAAGAILMDGRQSSVFVAVGCAIALISLVLGSPRGTVTTRFMESTVVVFVGQRAYEIYLLHQLILNVIRPWIPVVDEPARGLILTVLGFAAIVLAASIAHAFIGQPLIGWGRRIAGHSRPPQQIRTP